MHGKCKVLIASKRSAVGGESEHAWKLSSFSFIFQPIYKKFTENKWECSNEIMNEIIKTTSNHISELRTLKDPFYHVSQREAGTTTCSCFSICETYHIKNL